MRYNTKLERVISVIAFIMFAVCAVCFGKEVWGDGFDGNIGPVIIVGIISFIAWISTTDILSRIQGYCAGGEDGYLNIGDEETSDLDLTEKSVTGHPAYDGSSEWYNPTDEEFYRFLRLQHKMGKVDYRHLSSAEKQSLWYEYQGW